MSDNEKSSSDGLTDFVRVMEACSGLDGKLAGNAGENAKRLRIDEENVKNGLARLVLTLIKLIHELLEKQAIRRMDSGSLTDEQIERLGLTLMKQADELEILRRNFGLEEDDLNLDLGPLGKLL